MNKRPYYWIKLHTNYINNIKFLQLPDNTKWHYIALYLMACECDAGGYLIQENVALSLSELSLLLYLNDNDLHNSVKLLIDANLLLYDDDAIVIRKFIEEQGKETFGDKIDKQREQWRLRQEKYQDKKKITNPF